MRNNQYIELDCPPGWPRPGDLIEGVLEGTGLEVKEPGAKFFGNWAWFYEEVPAERWAEIQKIVKPRIEELYHRGMIRWGSW